MRISVSGAFNARHSVRQRQLRRDGLCGYPDGLVGCIQRTGLLTLFFFGTWLQPGRYFLPSIRCTLNCPPHPVIRARLIKKNVLYPHAVELPGIPGERIKTMPLPVQSRMDQLLLEQQALREYSDERFAREIVSIGFACKRCARCCTKEFKGHAFLLDGDVTAIRRLCPGALIPSPFFEYCDQYGRFYTAGYALRTRADGACTFLDHIHCAIYGERPAACRMYPYMLRRESDDQGNKSWRQFGRPDCHGLYLSPISKDEAVSIARETKRYEEEVINHELRYLAFIRRYFEEHLLIHNRRTYDTGIRNFLHGESVIVMVYYCDTFEENEVMNYMY
jgi:Fe-S-cluster containining protein